MTAQYEKKYCEQMFIKLLTANKNSVILFSIKRTNVYEEDGEERAVI